MHCSQTLRNRLWLLKKPKVSALGKIQRSRFCCAFGHYVEKAGNESAIELMPTVCSNPIMAVFLFSKFFNINLIYWLCYIKEFYFGFEGWFLFNTLMIAQAIAP